MRKPTGLWYGANDTLARKSRIRGIVIVNAAHDKTILFVDDDRELRASMKKVLQKEDYRVLLADNPKIAMELLEIDTIDIVIADVRMPEMDGFEFLKIIKSERQDIEVLLLTGYGTIEMAVQAIREGAYDFIPKPFKRTTVLKAVEKAIEKQELVRENRFLKEQLNQNRSRKQIIGESKLINAVHDLIKRVAPIESTVLITGESGTGKELVAREIYRQSKRAQERFVVINCGAIAENLMESELFGHVKGAFTGAIRDKVGLFKIASGGTLFLDEISNIPIHLQIKLLRAIEEKEIMPVGGVHTIPVDVRIIAASNQNLLHEIELGKFREDLFYRLNVVGIELPPLRDRIDDIPLLVNHFIAIHNPQLNKRIKGIHTDTLKMLQGYSWKGNVRELDNVIERAMILCDEDLIQPGHLPPNLFPAIQNEETNGTALKDALKDFERRFILKALKRSKNDKRSAADTLGLSQSSLYRKMHELNISDINL
ncbi:sigma-54-dependent Fis family transcriptional regulator [candidate division KSB1 bacterium]|nr:sigma-54-dependent Fis family transcriptional regulator [candidate division KSB1 bacterium]